MSIATIYSDVAYNFFHLINSVSMETNYEYMNMIIKLLKKITF